MKLSSAIALLAATTTASARTIAQPRAALAPYFYTIGDSTVTETAGWGQGFREFTNGASGENRAVSGTTTVSWKSNGRWADLLEAIGTKNTTHRVIVTLQWGHNDQKSDTGITLDDYRENIVNYVKDLKAVGATPIVVTPITRRTFVDGKVREDFKDWRGKAIAASKDAGAYWLDLTLASTNYMNAIGEEDAQKYNWGDAGTDRTHLNSSGSKVFGRMVIDLLLAKRSDLAGYFKANEKLSGLIKAGEYATGDE